MSYFCGGGQGCADEYSVHRVQKQVVDALELELQAIVSHLMGVLGSELGSSARAAKDS